MKNNYSGIAILLFMLCALPVCSCTAETKQPGPHKTIYDFSARTIDGAEKSLAEYRGTVVLIVNVASKCGFTPQYKGLQELYENIRTAGLSSWVSVQPVRRSGVGNKQ